jgi:hypothetical protein
MIMDCLPWLLSSGLPSDVEGKQMDQGSRLAEWRGADLARFAGGQ